MAHIDIRTHVDLQQPTLVEGLPGVGLVGKIAADHLVDEFEMTHYANLHCDSIPDVAVYQADDQRLLTPVRLYADSERDLVVLQSDIPIPSNAATAFAGCFSDWFDDLDATPIYLSGLGTEKDETPPSLHGIAAGDGGALLAAADIPAPDEPGVVQGPTGALLARAIEEDRTSVGLVVEADPQFPDPEAARIVVTEGIEALTGIEVPTDDLVEHADQIREAKEKLAKRMQESEDESTKAQPLRMYQ